MGPKFRQNIFAMLVKGKLVVKLPRVSGGCAHRLWRREPFDRRQEWPTHEGVGHRRTNVVTASYFPGLFHCYDVADLPRTNNDLEQYFGSACYHERHATGRNVASPSVVVRGTVRVVAGVATRHHHFCGVDLQPTDIERWYILLDELDLRQQARRAQFRFRRDPGAYLATLEDKLLLLRLPP